MTLAIRHLGVSRLPQVPFNNATPYNKFAYSQGPLAWCSRFNTLDVIGHYQGQLCSSVQTPAPSPLGLRDWTKYTTAKLWGATWMDITSGLRAQLATEQKQQFFIQGMAYSGSILYLCLWQYYDTQPGSNPCLMAVLPDGSVKGVWFAGDINSLKTAGYLAAAPDGAIYLGNCEAKADGNWGPALYRWDHQDLTLPHRGKQAVTPIMEWPMNQPFVWNPPKLAYPDHYGDDPSCFTQPFLPWKPNWRIGSCAVVDDGTGNLQAIFPFSRSLGMEWYGMPRITDGVSAISTRDAAGKGYNWEGRTSSLLVFPNAIATLGADRSYYEISLQQEMVVGSGGLSITADHTNRRLYLLEEKGDPQLVGPVLHCLSF